LAKAEIKKIPLLGAIASPFCIFVDRKNKRSRSESMDSLVKAVERDGSSILVYPEGTRNRTDQPLKEFYDGAFRIAIRTKVSIVVQTLVNSRHLGPPDDLLNLAPGVIQCYWSEPIPTENLSLTDVKELKEQVKSIMIENLNRHAIKPN
jgi:1-acyl-sn-glycerol-3-phosphate acyltransferase